MAVQGTLRERRRADSVAEIKAAALGLLAEGGPDALTLRAVAREVGVSVQALYHYVDSRDALITALVTDAFCSLTEAVRAGRASGRTRSERLVGAGLAYRQWAHDHRPAFLLALGAPLPDYAAPEGGPTTEAARGLGLAFQDVVFDGWTPEQIAGVAPGDPLPTDDTPEGLPPGARQLFVLGWASLHGFVMLEAQGHLAWLADDGAQTCRSVLERYAETVERAREG